MASNRPRCPVCAGQMKKNGTTSKDATRWRCKDPNCGSTTTRHRSDQAHTRDFHAFHSYVTGTANLTDIAGAMNMSRRTLDRRFQPFWLIDIPNTPDPHRIYDHIFIDGTYTAAGYLLVAASYNHVIAWHWTHRETTHAYTQLLSMIAEPLCVVLDGGQGAYTAIKTCWPHTLIQRCLVHAQRVIRRYTTSRPRTDAGKAIYALALKTHQHHNPRPSTRMNGHCVCMTSGRSTTSFSTRKHPCRNSITRWVNSGNGLTCRYARPITGCCICHATIGYLPTCNRHRVRWNHIGDNQQPTA